MTTPTKLDVPAATGLRAGCGCLSALVLFLLAAVAVVVFTGETTPGQKALILGLFVGVPLAVLAALWVVIVRRASTWVEGSTLVRRVAFRDRRIDLTAARADFRDPMLVIVDPATGTLRLPLRDARGAWLPAPQLRALADALDADPRHEPIVRGLRDLAGDPPR
ncbi:hypothetical protein OIE66_08305 [Nonomuraea sp. NBC_01738]|uniref:hypothetical protein n=1 Tax=Nonomuraea sp. NBC_01738 TaxID=2976003 RepID=UPI002E134D20|nr:hypothetical protein OIE66_08305 [Nonomuraea sp. NBC_01738]